MDTFISLLRGINVGGHRKIKMEDLKKVYESLGFKEVKTYIQSGNVIFKSDNCASELTTKIEDKIVEVFGFEVRVIIRTKEEFEQIVENNPFANDELRKVCVGFLSSNPVSIPHEEINRVKKTSEKYLFSEKEIYLYFDNGIDTKLTNSFIEKKLKVAVTMRNWNTVNKLLALTEHSEK